MYRRTLATTNWPDSPLWLCLSGRSRSSQGYQLRTSAAVVTDRDTCRSRSGSGWRKVTLILQLAPKRYVPQLLVSAKSKHSSL